MELVARLIEAFCYVFGSLIRCVIFTTLDVLGVAGGAARRWLP